MKCILQMKKPDIISSHTAMPLTIKKHETDHVSRHFN